MFEHLPPHPFPKLSTEGIALGDVRALHALARQGSWRAVLDKTKAALAPTGSNPSSSHLAGTAASLSAAGSPAWLSLKAYQILALVKLRTYGAAADELKLLGNLDDPRYNTAPDGSSAVPHALRVVAAELPRLLGQPARTVDALYELADRCAREAETAAAGRAGGSGDCEISGSGGGVSELAEGVEKVVEDATVDFGAGAGVGVGADAARVWRRRRDAALHAAVNLHVAGKDHAAALARLDWMSRCRPADRPDPTVLSIAGRVHLQLGDIDGAQLCFSAAQSAAASAAAAAAATADTTTSSSSSSVHSPDATLQCKVDAGLLAFARKDYAGAKKQFEAVLAVHPWDATAANNCAAACMYTRDLRGGIRVLEEALTCHPTATAQHETLVLNLCSMYELASAVPTAAKRSLANWVLHVAPDDLDPTCTRL